MKVEEATGNSTLLGLTVLVTRPLQKLQPLCDALEAKGATAVKFPLLEILPISQVGAMQRLKSKIQDLDHYDMLIFISSNAVIHAAELINDYWPQFPIDLPVFAIGPSTAQTASSLLGCEVTYSERGMSSEDVLALPELSNVSGKRIGIFRGIGGRELLASTLLSRNATVDYLEVYERRALSYPDGKLGQVLQSKPIDAVIVTSGESLDSLLTLAGDNKQQLSLIPLIVPSARTAQQAKDAGFHCVVNASGADETSLLTALQEIAAQADKTGSQ